MARNADSEKTVYVKPTLIRYGRVAQLTQAGSGMSSEDNSASGCVDLARKPNPGCLM